MTHVELWQHSDNIKVSNEEIRDMKDLLKHACSANKQERENEKSQDWKQKAAKTQLTQLTSH